MSDSDEDEFVSASEGEEEQSAKDTHDEKSVELSFPEPQTASTDKEESHSEPEKAAEDPKEDEVDHLSSLESLQDLRADFKASISSVSDSGLSVASLPTEKKELLAEVVKEVESVSTPSTTQSDDRISSSNELQQTPEQKELGSDKAEAEDSNTQEPELPEDSQVELDLPNMKLSSEEADFSIIQQKETVDKSCSSAAETIPNGETVEDETGDWDDWGSEAVKPTEVVTPTTTNNSWDDWSLVDAKKLPESKENPWEKEENDDKKGRSIMDKISHAPSESSGWGWGGIVAAVGETFSSTIESSLGFPSAEEMAKRVSEEKKKEAEQLENEAEPSVPEVLPEPSSSTAPLSSGFGLLSGFVTGGIDVLEAIGKKTFEAVTVADSKKGGRRRLLFAEEEGANLSDILKELKETNQQTISMGGVGSEKPSVDVASLFGRSEGMSHLEALEMLSNNTQTPDFKFEREYFAALNAVDVESPYTSDFVTSLNCLIKRIGLPYEAKALINADNEIDTRLSWCDGKTEEELFADSVNSFVEFTAAAVQVVAKLANLLIIMGQNCDWRDFVTLYSELGRRLNHIGIQYTETLAATSFDEQKVDDISTQMLLEVSTALDFLRQSHRLLAPMFKT